MLVGEYRMESQKKIALINDVTGFGRCSVAVELPLVSALKVQGCVLPTAILSVHTGFLEFYIDDYTNRMTEYIDSWVQNQLTFDGVLTGFIGSEGQIEIIIDFIKKQKQGTSNPLIIVDPVMGDNGQLYASYNEAMCKAMQDLVAHADLIMPNYTEACFLLNHPYGDESLVSHQTLVDMADKLSKQGPQYVVITGLSRGDTIETLVYERGKEPVFISSNRIGGERSGTGDVFAAIVAASLVQGEALEPAVRKAIEFIRKTLYHTVKLDLPHNYGLAFEEFLTELK